LNRTTHVSVGHVYIGHWNGERRWYTCFSDSYDSQLYFLLPLHSQCINCSSEPVCSLIKRSLALYIK